MKPRMRYVFVLLCALAACNAGCRETPSKKPMEPRPDFAERKIPGIPSKSAAGHGDGVRNKADANKAVPDAGAENPMDSDEAGLSILRTAAFVDARLISSRTLSMKVELINGDKAVFKPILKNDSRALREVAVFRLAKLLEVRQVPLSTMRSAPLPLLVELLKKKNPKQAEELSKRAVTDDKGFLPGAVIQWLFGLEEMSFKKLGGSAAMQKWLSFDRPLETLPPLASGAAAMIAFDYMVGNWDRFSGGNLYVSANGGEFALLDHNGSLAPWSKRQKDKMKKLLARTHRFPAALIGRIRKMKAGDIETAMAREPWNEKEALIKPEEIELLLLRRNELLAHVDKLILARGEKAVLAFP